MLDDDHRLGVANKLAVLLDDDRVEVVRMGEIVGTIEVVESVQGRNPAPAFKGLAPSSCDIRSK